MAATEETVLVVGATGRIGTSVIIAARRTGRHVLAIVRNQDSREKMFRQLGFRDGITSVEADVTAEDGVLGVMEQVKAGKLPAFQHVYASLGYLNWTTPVYKIPTEEFRKTSRINIEGNFFAYRATTPYLLEHGGPNATYTLITGGFGEMGMAGVSAMTQGALFSMATCAIRELTGTNVRFNEVYLARVVEFDGVAADKAAEGWLKVSDFAQNYVAVLERTDLRGVQIRVETKEDLKVIRQYPKVKA